LRPRGEPRDLLGCRRETLGAADGGLIEGFGLLGGEIHAESDDQAASSWDARQGLEPREPDVL
jgi:hypothetical protein